MSNQTEIQKLIDRGALFVINSSGGKDSQAMTIKLRKMIPLNQLVLVHAHLPEVEWEGSVEHITANAMGIPVRVCQSGKTFIEMVEHRGMFPSPQQRQCTSDLKRAPIEKLVRQISKETGNLLIVNCMGMRSEESDSRKKLVTFKKSERNSKAGREWYDWLPIHELKVGQVFNIIREAGQKAFWTYAEGMTRKSCCFCIMASKSDLCTSARLRPALYERMVNLERKINYTMDMKGNTLESIVGTPVAQALQVA